METESTQYISNFDTFKKLQSSGELLTIPENITSIPISIEEKRKYEPLALIDVGYKYSIHDPKQFREHSPHYPNSTNITQIFYEKPELQIPEKITKIISGFDKKFSDPKNKSLLNNITAKILPLAGNNLPANYSIPSYPIPSNNSFPNTYVDIGSTKPEDLPELAMPIIKFIDEVKPHIVIGCDRGGRLFSLAVHAAWQQTKEGKPFPTVDGSIHFARISKSEDPEVLQEKIDEIIEGSLMLGKQRGNELEEDEQLRIMFIDDWVIGGGTVRLSERLVKKHNAMSYFVVMCGPGADATGDTTRKTRVVWHDRTEEIGVNYLSSLVENTDGSITQTLEVVPVRTEKAKVNRDKIQAAARLLTANNVLADVA